MKDKKMILSLLAWLGGVTLLWFLGPQPDLGRLEQGRLESWPVIAVPSHDDLLHQASITLMRQQVTAHGGPARQVKITLLGIVQQGQVWLALLDVDGRAHRFMAGDILSDGVVVEKIMETSILISRDGDQEMIPLYPDK